MNRKIIDFKTLQCSSIEDYDARSAGEYMAASIESRPRPEPIIYSGMNTKAKELIDLGFEPYGELKISYSPRYTLPGSYATGGGVATYVRDFVKYEQEI